MPSPSRRRRLRPPAVVGRVGARIAAVVSGVRRGVGAAVAGNRPFTAVLIGLLVLGVLMLAGPARNFLEGRSRVEVLQAKLAALTEENAELEERTRELRDLDQVELLAREQLGMIEPGEVPYAIVPPQIERPRITAPREPPPPPSQPWYDRLWHALFG
ncbi:MAG: septum formation initiator family protein [Actinobacteria bacterium]|nr:septum formation initiator family protein [Actinomycetota bacterium]